MRRLLIVLAVALASVASTPGQTDQPIAELLNIHQYDVAAEDKALLEKEARAASGAPTTWPACRCLHGSGCWRS